MKTGKILMATIFILIGIGCLIALAAVCETATILGQIMIFLMGVVFIAAGVATICMGIKEKKRGY